MVIFFLPAVLVNSFQTVTTGISFFKMEEGDDRRTVVCFQQQLLEFTMGNHKWEKARDTGEYRGMEETEVEDEDSKSFVKGSDLVSDVSNSSHVSNGFKDRKDTEFLSAKDTSPKTPNAFENSALIINDTSASEAEIFRDCENDLNPPTLKPSLESSAEPSPAGTPNKRNPRRSKSRRPVRAVYVPPRGRGKPLSPNAMEFRPQVVNEITTAVGGVQIATPAVDYKSFQTSDSTINIDQFGHVIEIYDFPQQMKTNDLMAAFHAFTSR